MIRSEFHIDPWRLSDEEFLDRWTEAAWLLQHKAYVLARLCGFIKDKE